MNQAKRTKGETSTLRRDVVGRSERYVYLCLGMTTCFPGETGTNRRQGRSFTARPGQVFSTAEKNPLHTACGYH